jgi:hypothetical protein
MFIWVGGPVEWEGSSIARWYKTWSSSLIAHPTSSIQGVVDIKLERIETWRFLTTASHNQAHNHQILVHHD